MATIDDIVKDIRHILKGIKKDAEKTFKDEYEILGIVALQEVNFSDGSLDLPAKDESYIQMIIPGYKIICDALEKSSGMKVMLGYHVDRTGENIKWKNIRWEYKLSEIELKEMVLKRNQAEDDWPEWRR